MRNPTTRSGSTRTRFGARTALVFLALALSPASVPAEDVDAHVDAARLFEQGNRLYGVEDYPGALQAYERILELRLESAGVYLNLGNAALKSGMIGRAVWAYARARRLDPGDADVRANLAYVRALRADAAPRERGSRFLGALASITERVRTSDALRLASWLYWTLALCVVLVLLTRARAARVASVATGVTLALVLLFAGTKAAVSNGSELAVVLPEVVDVMSAPGDGGRTVFTLHAGAEVRFDRRVGGWVEISLGSDLEGWVPETAVAVI